MDPWSNNIVRGNSTSLFQVQRAMDPWSNNIVRGNSTSLHLRAFFYRGGGDPTSEPTVEEVRFRIHLPEVFRFQLLSLSSLFPRQLRRLQLESMLSHVVVHLNIPTVVHPYGPSVDSAHARMADGVLVLHEGFRLDGHRMLSLEEEAGGTRGFGSVPASKSSIKTLDTKTYQGDGQDGSSACSVCLEILEAGAELVVLPCSHEFHASCATKWPERSHLCPLCRYPMPTVDGEGATA